VSLIPTDVSQLESLPIELRYFHFIVVENCKLAFTLPSQSRHYIR